MAFFNKLCKFFTTAIAKNKIPVSYIKISVVGGFMNVRNLSAQNSFKNSNPAFQRLIMQDACNGDYSCDFSDELYCKVVNNKEIQKLVAEYHTIGKDIYASCIVHKGMDIGHDVVLSSHSGYPLGWRLPPYITRIDESKIDSFKADTYLKRPQAMRFLDIFNQALVNFNYKISDRIDEFVKNDTKNVFNDELSNNIDGFVDSVEDKMIEATTKDDSNLSAKEKFLNSFNK